jgi:hypothetical protein
VVTSKPAIRGHFKTGQRSWARDAFLRCSPIFKHRMYPCVRRRLRAGSGVKGGAAGFCRAVHRRPLTQRTARYTCDRTKRELRPRQDSCLPVFPLLCLSPVFHRKMPRQDRPGATIGNSVESLHPRFCIPSAFILISPDLASLFLSSNSAVRI